MKIIDPFSKNLKECRKFPDMWAQFAYSADSEEINQFRLKDGNFLHIESDMDIKNFLHYYTSTLPPLTHPPTISDILDIDSVNHPLSKRELAIRIFMWLNQYQSLYWPILRPNRYQKYLITHGRVKCYKIRYNDRLIYVVKHLSGTYDGGAVDVLRECYKDICSYFNYFSQCIDVKFNYESKLRNDFGCYIKEYDFRNPEIPYICKYKPFQLDTSISFDDDRLINNFIHYIRIEALTNDDVITGIPGHIPVDRIIHRFWRTGPRPIEVDPEFYSKFLGYRYGNQHEIRKFVLDNPHGFVCVRRVDYNNIFSRVPGVQVLTALYNSRAHLYFVSLDNAHGGVPYNKFVDNVITHLLDKEFQGEIKNIRYKDPLLNHAVVCKLPGIDTLHGFNTQYK